MATKMTNKERAKIFMPFDALKGLREELREQERIKVDKKELSDSYIDKLNAILKRLEINMLVAIDYYSEDDLEYLHLEGVVTDINDINKTITIVTTVIDTSNIYNLVILQNNFLK